MGGELFTREERDALREVLTEELRIVGMLDFPRPDDLDLPTYVVDTEAEEQLIAMAEAGQVAKIDPREFGSSLRALLFVMIATCWKNKKPPTLQRILWLLRQEGYFSRVFEIDATRMMLETPIRMTVGVAVKRVLEASRRRRMQQHVHELSALLKDARTTNATLASSLQKLMEAARGK
jgi:hypothetical protein